MRRRRTYHLQRSHATHTSTHNMHILLRSLAYMINDLLYVPRHLRGRVPPDRPVALAHTSVVHYETREFISLLVAEIEALELPVPHRTGKAHHPLCNETYISVLLMGTASFISLVRDYVGWRTHVVR